MKRRYLIYTTAIGFEPMREYPSGFLVHHLNHSVKQSESSLGDSNARPYAY